MNFHESCEHFSLVFTIFIQSNRILNVTRENILIQVTDSMKEQLTLLMKTNRKFCNIKFQ